MPEESVTVRVGDESKSQARVEHRLGKLLVEIPPVAKRVTRFFIATVAGTDLPDGLADGLVSLCVRARPPDMVRPGHRTLRSYPFDQVATVGHFIPRHDRKSGTRKVDTLVPGTRVRFPGPLVSDQGGKLTRYVVALGHRLEVFPLPRPDTFPEKRLVIRQGREIVPVSVSRA